MVLDSQTKDVRHDWRAEFLRLTKRTQTEQYSEEDGVISNEKRLIKKPGRYFPPPHMEVNYSSIQKYSTSV